ncbi:hypothetical protein SAMN04487917_105313 [Arthrobacter sp. yr096]|uniref:three component ABC system middle component n=1 Tax=Arthrobacter sp. yr096 TaxID=1761750 RepID=UPI0008D29A99|nr:hypothetical protein SAMN04487917_105313 [Arthrobacter sp. yr096]
MSRVWLDLPRDSAALFNPALLAVTVLRGVQGAVEEGKRGLPWETAYLVVPMCLDADVRSALSMRLNTPMVSWIASHPSERAAIPGKAAAISPLVTVGLDLALRTRTLAIDGALIVPGEHKVPKVIKSASSEVAQIQKAAKYLGRWLTVNPNTTAVLNIFGVRP